MDKDSLPVGVAFARLLETITSSSRDELSLLPPFSALSIGRDKDKGLAVMVSMPPDEDRGRRSCARRGEVSALLGETASCKPVDLLTGN